MTLKDRLGNFVSTSQSEVIDAIDDFTSQLLHLGPEVADIIKTADKFPDNYLLQLYGAFFYLLGQAKLLHQKAHHYLERANSLLVNQISDREKSFYIALNLWYQNRLSEALNHLENHCLKWDNDLAALKATEFIYYCKGQEYEGKRFLNLTEALYSKWKDNPLFLSMHSFALELTKHYDKAEKEAKRALDLEGFNSWAHHTLCHVYMNRGEIDKGIDQLESFVPVWKKSGRLIESHNMWHLALMYLENLDFKQSFRVYERADWKSKIHTVGEEVDLSSLLWRYDMENQECSDKWKNLAAAIGDRANFASIPFVNVQLFYALKRGGKLEELKEGMNTLLHFAESMEGEDRKVWQKVGLPLIYGSLAFADKDFKTALNHFDPIISSIGCAGGSDAQVDLFRQTYLKSLIGARRKKEARDFLAKLTQGRSMTTLEKKWLNETQNSG